TPHLDALHGESLRLTDYHVSPTCTPTRAALLTGRYTNRTGAWHTIMGRSLLRADERTMADHFGQAGYETGIFGKWHLGDAYPFTPQHRGFKKTFVHGGGGVGQTPDLWNNSYFDDVYLEDGKPVASQGFCTDVFFAEATQYIESQVAVGKPFFAYISTNAPHGPLHCPEKYLARYPDLQPALQAFYGMITNIDDNVGALRKKLKDLGVAENTIFIFTTDNGTAGGARAFSAGMRGNKGSPYEGGHRVPFFLHWPAQGWHEGRDIDTLTAHIDVLPTLADYCGVSLAEAPPIDGRSLRPLLEGDGGGEEWAGRVIITDSQRVVDPIKWKSSSVMKGRYRLIKGKELYDLATDPGQRKNLAGENPQKVAELRAAYEAWWADLEPGFAKTAAFQVGVIDEPMELTAHDLISEGGANDVAWHQGSIRAGKITGIGKSGRPAHWFIEVKKAGKYRATLSRYPLSAGLALQAPAPALPDVPGASKAFRTTPGRALDIRTAKIWLGGEVVAEKEAAEGAVSVVLDIELPAGRHELAATFHGPGLDTVAYYLTLAERVD
ncbi:MAG: arylsulfatase, partial [Verrucomicrobiales bacterium]